MNKITLILTLLFIPQIASAFMDTPTVTVTFPTYLVILVPLIACEVAYISQKSNISKPNLLKTGILVHLIAIVTMVLGGLLHQYLRIQIIEAIHLKTTGIFTILRNPPSVLDVIFSLSIGSVVIMQDAEYRWLNLIVLFVFLLPTFLLSTYLGVKLLSRLLPNADKTGLKSIFIRVKGVEYGSLVVASLLYLYFSYKY